MIRHMKPRKHWWVWILVGLYIYMIFHNSMMVASASESLSLKVTHFFAAHIERFGLYVSDISTLNHYVRKAAHFTEFAGLGFLVTIAMHICPLFHSRFLNFALFLFAVPFADETIQRYVPGRGPSGWDMLIDGSGFLCGGLSAYILVLIIKDLFFRKKKH